MLPHMSLRSVFDHMKILSRQGFLEKKSSPVVKKVVESLKDFSAVEASGLLPEDVFRTFW